MSIRAGPEMASGPIAKAACVGILRCMGEREPQIVAFGGGGFSMEAGNPLLDDYVLALTGRARPKVCFLPTASGDADHYIVRFYRHFAATLRRHARVAVPPRPRARARSRTNSSATCSSRT